MKNNKQINIQNIIRKNRFFSHFRCWKRINELSNKTILTKFEKQELFYLNNRLTHIDASTYMEDVPCS